LLLFGCLLETLRHASNELQSLFWIAEAPLGESLSRLHREHCSGELRIVPSGAPRGKLFIATPQGVLVVSYKPFGLFRPP
jgi:hypothetical protein